MPVESLVNKFAHQRFEPMGMTTNLDIPFAKSLVDYIFRWLGMQFIAGYKDANAPKRVPPMPAPVPAIDESAPEATVARAERIAWSEPTAARFSADDSPPESTELTSTYGPIIAERGELRRGGEVLPSAQDQANAQLMGDAPACDVCGSITVRNGTCYRCWNCGHSMGCS